MTLRGTFNKRPGFTALELIVVLAIFAMAAVTAVPLIGSFQERQTLKTHAQNVVQVLRRAQNRAMLGERDSMWGVKFQTGSYILYAGSDYAGRNFRFDETHGVPVAIRFAGFSEVMFNKGLGSPVTPGLLTITHVNGQLQTITIGSNGLISNP
ncbi:MAG: type II secretion system protein [Candidatus Peribacteraceae bacterium]|nr:type II secretion system protein [Candidatus Peribacteraceae bacterium]MDD5074543.1 type II secretion system protein [Candidatus Peribacteraceae bacterium]